jgi:hypothetical protein
LEKIHKAYHAGDITRKDVEKFNKSGHWDYNMFAQAFTAMARTDFTHVLKTLGYDQLDTRDLYEIGRSTSIDKTTGELLTDRNQKYSHELLLVARWYYEGQRFLKLSEALDDGSFIENANIEELAPAPESGSLSRRFNFHASAKNHLPPLENVTRSFDQNLPLRIAMKVLEEKKDASEATRRKLAMAWRTATDQEFRHSTDADYPTAPGRLKDPFKFEIPDSKPELRNCA